MAKSKRKPTNFGTNGIELPKLSCKHEFVVAKWDHDHFEPIKNYCWKCGYVR